MIKQTLVDKARSLIEEKKGGHTVLIDLREETIPTSFFLITQADNATQVKAIVNHLLEKMPQKHLHREGSQGRRWVILDYGDLVVHVFHRDAREFYDLDGLWSDHLLGSAEEEASELP